jgi:AraC-like DNA-binding protein
LSQHLLRAQVLAERVYRGDWLDSGPWPTGEPVDTGRFHLVSEGRCLLSGADLASPIALSAGDLALFPTGAAHCLGSIASVPGHPPADDPISLLCGVLEFQDEAMRAIREALPRCLIIRSEDDDTSYNGTAQMLLSAIRERRPGHRILIGKLVEALFAAILDIHSRRSEQLRSLLAALTDVRLTRVLEAIHRRAGDDWSLQSLAAVAGMSRSVFARRFNETIGVPPMHYLAACRVAEAERVLHQQRQSVASVAGMMGYSSETAFRKMYKRVSGEALGTMRARIAGSRTVLPGSATVGLPAGSQ